QAGRELLEAEPPRRAPTSVVTVELLRLWIPDDRKQVAADAAHVRLDQRQHRVCGDGRVDRTPALFERLDGDERCDRMGGRGHPVKAQHGTAGGEVLTGITGTARFRLRRER